MSVIARLYKDAELDIAGEVNERLPKVTDRLLFNLPMDGSLIPETVGRNLAYNSSIKSFLSDLTINTNNITLTVPARYAGIYIDMYELNLDLNKIYTLHFKIKQLSGNLTKIGGDYKSYSGSQAIYKIDGTEYDDWQLPIDISNLNDGNYHDVIYQFKLLSFINNGGTIGRLYIQPNRILDNTTPTQVEIKDLKFECSETATPWTPAPEDIQSGIVATNCNLTNDGIYVEESTTNLITDSVNMANLHSHPSDVNATLVDNGFYRCLISNDDEILQSNTGSFRTVKASTTYTESFLFRTDSTNLDNNDFGITFFTSKHNKVKCNIEKLNNNIYKAWASYTTTSTETGIRALDINGVNTLNGSYIDIKNAQLEEKPYATSYTSGTRASSDNGVQIPTSFFQFPFSVTMDVIPDIKDGSNSVYGSEPNHMYIAGLWKYSIGEIDQRLRSSIMNGAEKGFRYTIVFRLSTYDIYLNNTKILNNGNYAGIFNLTDIPMFTVGCRGYEPQYGYANALYRNIAFYNRELTQDDVNKLCNNKFSITKEGNINGLELIEDDRDMTKMSITKDEIHLNELSEGGDL